MSILRADSIRDRAGTGAPDFPNGATVTGVVTATSFSGNLTGNADTATALSGTPNITVGIVTGTDATFSGNLTVNGTTTTIDTAVTAVDSLAVDGNITSGGDLSISAGGAERFNISHVSGGDVLIKNPTPAYLAFGTNNTEKLRIHSHGQLELKVPDANPALKITPSGTNATAAIDFNTPGTGVAKLLVQGTERLRITSGGTAIFKAGLAEKYNAVGGTLGSNTNNSMNNGNVIEFDGNESGNLTINFTAVHATLSQGENCSFTVLIRPNGSGVINAVQIDGQSPAGGLRWSGGSVPSAGAASSYDIYTFTIFKYGTANTNYRVFGAATNYA